MSIDLIVYQRAWDLRESELPPLGSSSEKKPISGESEIASLAIFNRSSIVKFLQRGSRSLRGPLPKGEEVTRTDKVKEAYLATGAA